MTVLAAECIERPALLFGPGPEPPEPPERPEPAVGRVAAARDRGLDGGLTLDEAIVGAWEGLAALVAVACPLCGGALRPRSKGADAGGRCGDCGTTLS
jgi:hypothetical protein